MMTNKTKLYHKSIQMLADILIEANAPTLSSLSKDDDYRDIVNQVMYEISETFYVSVTDVATDVDAYLQSNRS